MIIEVDCGNTRAKWRLDGGDVFSHDYSQSLLESTLVEAIRQNSVSKLRVANVKHHCFIDQLEAFCNSINVPMSFARTSRHTAGVTNSYVDVSRMGVDRWLAVVAAYARCNGPCVIVDAGTALTVDCVGADGKHFGGLIVPGKKLLLEALNQRTSKVLFPPDKAMGCLKLGRSTEEAVYNGIAHMLAGTVNESVARFETHLGLRPLVFVAGGDAKELMPSLHVEFEEWPNIVLDGLRYVTP